MSLLFISFYSKKDGLHTLLDYGVHVQLCTEYTCNPPVTNNSNYHPLQRHCTEIWKIIFPERKLRDLSPTFYIHLSVGDLYIPTIGLPIWLQEKR
jgi:hypothetical protein